MKSWRSAHVLTDGMERRPFGGAAMHGRVLDGDRDHPFGGVCGFRVRAQPRLELGMPTTVWHSWYSLLAIFGGDSFDVMTSFALLFYGFDMSGSYEARALSWRRLPGARHWCWRFLLP